MVMKKIIVIIVAFVLVAAIAIAAVLILGNIDRSPVKINSFECYYRGDFDSSQSPSFYIHFENTDSKEIDTIHFSIRLLAGKEVVRQFDHREDNNLAANSISPERVWNDAFYNSDYTAPDITKVEIAIIAYKFVGEDSVTIIEKPVWKSF